MLDYQMLREVKAVCEGKSQMFLDSTHAGKKPDKEPKKPKQKDDVVTDDVTNTAAVFQEQAIASDAMNLLNEWLDTDESDLDSDEGFGDRLYHLMIGLADENKDGDISDDEAEIINVGLNAVADYLVAKGVDEDKVVSLLEEFDNNLANNVREIVLANLPEGEEALFEDMDKVIFSAEENQSVLDSVQRMAEKQGLTLDAVYRKTFAIRHGKKMRINKRISGKVRLSAKQKVAIRKAQRKAQTGAAKLRRLKSFRLSKRLGL